MNDAASNIKTKDLGWCRKLGLGLGAVIIVAIAVLMPYFAVQFAEGISELRAQLEQMKRNHTRETITVDAWERRLDNMSQLTNAFDALKRRLGNMSRLTTTVDAMERRLNNMSQLTVASDRLKRDLDNERKRTATLKQRLHELMLVCPKGYSKFRGTCFKAFTTKKTFNEADAACRKDGGTLAMPRDAETNAFLFSLVMSVCTTRWCGFWIGLNDRREEGRFEWMDGSALGKYNSWYPGEPDNRGGNEDCVFLSVVRERKWADYQCDDNRDGFICQVAPGRK